MRVTQHIGHSTGKKEDRLALNLVMLTMRNWLNLFKDFAKLLLKGL